MTLLYRVFPHAPGAAAGEAGHPLTVSVAHQGRGRWDNPDLYAVMYLADTPEAAVGEAFGSLAVWSARMVDFPLIPGAVRALGTFRFNEGTHPFCDLDDAHELVRLAYRPTHVVIRNRPRTQALARRIFDSDDHAGIRWWSYHHPAWTVVAVWDLPTLTCERVDPLPGHAALDDAATILARPRHGI